MQPVPPYRRRLRLALAACCALVLARAATPQQPAAQLGSSAILHRMHKLGVVGSVLYIAAHPDDENTRLISYLSNGKLVRTGYLSLTRGDGGQNLIGPELGDALGVLRTQELLEARRIDGGEQFFTRAVDFGYSKTPEETFEKWGREAVLGDVVRVLRKFRPDVIITRFASDGSGGHGHHTASALLAREAFDLAADPRAYPEQLAQGLEPWQAKRLFFNASTWWNPKLADEARKDPSRWVEVDVGGYDPLLGASYTEIAGRSRSQHKSQGFGAAETRGALTEYLRLEHGQALAGPDPLAGVQLGWTRLPGGERVDAALRELLQGYDLRAPQASVPQLAKLVGVLDELAASGAPERGWARHHARAARELALQLCGTVVEATAGVRSVAQGDSLAVTLTAVQRQPGPALQLVKTTAPGGAATVVDQPLTWNRPLAREFRFTAAADADFDQPYWLAEPHAALYRPRGASTGIEPVARSVASFGCTLRVTAGLEVEVEQALAYKWVDRVAGERTRPAIVTPVASLEIADPVVLVTGERATVALEVLALRDELSGELEVRAPDGWVVERPPAAIAQLARGERQELEVGLRRTATARAGKLQLAFAGRAGRSDRTMHVIDYPHILPQTWYTPAEVTLLPLQVAVDVRTVGYIEGAGDDVAQAIERLGVAIERLDPATATPADLERCDAIVVGIRAYNTVRALADLQPRLLAYVERGGTLLVQYNTNGDDLVLPAKRLGPHPFALTRTRVTLEEAPATFLDAQHPLLTTPNALTAADFDGWVQERGLYFAGELDARYTAPIGWNDPGESQASGALIACDHGAGRFIYTGISLFRQLPAGVPGAYRLLANLLARRTPRAAPGTPGSPPSAPAGQR